MTTKIDSTFCFRLDPGQGYFIYKQKVLFSNANFLEALVPTAGRGHLVLWVALLERQLPCCPRCPDQAALTAHITPPWRHQGLQEPNDSFRPPLRLQTLLGRNRSNTYDCLYPPFLCPLSSAPSTLLSSQNSLSPEPARYCSKTRMHSNEDNSLATWRVCSRICNFCFVLFCKGEIQKQNAR